MDALSLLCPLSTSVQGAATKSSVLATFPATLTEHPDQNHLEKDGWVLVHRCRLPPLMEEAGAREGSWIASSLGCTLSLGLGAALLLG